MALNSYKVAANFEIIYKRLPQGFDFEKTCLGLLLASKELKQGCHCTATFLPFSFLFFFENLSSWE